MGHCLVLLFCNASFYLTIVDTVGDDGMQEYNARIGRKVPGKECYPSKTLLERFRIYFPSNQTVVNSKGGRQVKADPWMGNQLQKVMLS